MWQKIKNVLGRIFGNPKSRDPQVNGPCEVRVIGDTTAQYACSHEGPRQATLVFWGEERILKEDRDPATKECPQCLFDAALRVSIRCCLCGGIILPGDGVALYDPAINPQIGKPAWATAVSSGKLLGCMRWNCCPSGAFFAGDWTETGFRSAFGGRTAAQQALRTGGTVIVNNTRK